MKIKNVSPLIEGGWVERLLELYREALAKGQNPKDVGLPALPDPALFHVEAEDGRVIVARIASEADWERVVARLAEPAAAPPADTEEPAGEEATPPAPPKGEKPAPQTLVRQIVSLAALKGVEVPEIRTAREAREWYRKLSAM